MTTIRHMFACPDCNVTFSADYLNEHNLSVCPMEAAPEQFCYAELQPVIFVSDLKKMFSERITHLKTDKKWQAFDSRLVRIDEVELILSEIDPTENEKEE